jgi:hypothetical protein
MSLTSDQLLKKFKTVADSVKQDLRKKGVIVPTKNKDGLVKFDNVVIKKMPTGFYSIETMTGDVILDKINLPQSAVLLANGLALKKMVDDYFFNLDKEYGFRKFEVDLFQLRARQSLKKNNIDRADFLYTRLKISEDKAKSAKASIVNSFEKLAKYTK